MREAKLSSAAADENQDELVVFAKTLFECCDLYAKNSSTVGGGRDVFPMAIFGEKRVCGVCISMGVSP